MAGPPNTLFIDAPFEDLADELALYIDNLKKAQGVEQGAGLQADIAPLLEKGQKDEALKKLVVAGAALNGAPEKEFIAAYNLLIHLVRQSSNMGMFLPKICQHLSNPITSAPIHGPGLALSILTTIFNILEPDSETRYRVFQSMLKVIRANGLFETLQSQLKNLDSWLQEWETDEEDSRILYVEIADIAEEAGELEQSYAYLLRALQTFPSDECTSDEARTIALRALKAAISHPNHFDFQDLTSLDSVQALRKSDSIYFELLEIFSAQLLDDYIDFKDEHDGWIDDEKSLDNSILYRKMRLLTLASLAASTQSRSLPYKSIAKALQIPPEDVEMWVIDVIRAGLVEGKLSQLNQTFLIHRSTYRVFGEKQWREVATRLDTWRESLRGVLEVVKRERESVAMQREREAREAEGKANGAGGRGHGGQHQQTIDAASD
ncbi:MAG: hypothetical protein M1839_005573 [Geoglossum umbratile]|nr:MAG: hypothetical protein M1839_005573 [Geoglossum umbratile]